MFGPFRITNPLSGGLLWKIPWRLSKFQKRRHRLRLRAVDSVVATLDTALAKKGQTLEALERWKAEMPTEEEMLPRDKYTMFDRKAKRYRTGIHSTFCHDDCDSTTGKIVLTFWKRAAQVDESIATCQPSWLLSLEDEMPNLLRRKNGHTTILYKLSCWGHWEGGRKALDSHVGCVTAAAL